MKKAICLILSIITLIGVVPMGVYAEERPFPDVPADAWYTETIVNAHEMGLIQGDEKGNMMPTKPITRAEAVEIIRNHCKVIKDFSDVEEVPFTDVPKDAWYYEAIKWAYCYDIVKGVGNNKFKPDDLVTRQDFAVMLYRCYRFDLNVDSWGYNHLTVCRSHLNLMNDKNDISEYARSPMAFLSSELEITGQGEGGASKTSYPVINGYNGYLKPKANCSRSEAIQMIINILESTPIRITYHEIHPDFSEYSIPYLGT